MVLPVVLPGLARSLQVRRVTVEQFRAVECEFGQLGMATLMPVDGSTDGSGGNVGTIR